jgi:hypothetical protein
VLQAKTQREPRSVGLLHEVLEVVIRKIYHRAQR